MKNTFTKISVIFILIIVTLGFNFTSSAENEILGDYNEEIVNPADLEEDSNSNLYKAGNEDITINTDVNGDVFILSSKTVTINSNITGNVFICATNVVITENAEIGSSLFNVSQTLNIYGTIEKNVYAVSQNFTLNENAYLGLDLFLTAENANFNGFLSRDAYFSCESIKFSEDSSIAGNLNYSSSSESNVPEGVVSGELKFLHVNENKDNKNDLIEWIMSTLTFVILALAIFLSFKNFVPKFAEKNLNFKQNIGKYILYGLLALIVTPVISIILLTMEITAMVSIIVILAYVILLLISSSIFINLASIVLSEKLKEKVTINDTARQILFIVLLAIIYKAMQLIPILGTILTIIVNVIGAGILVKNSIPEKNTNTEVN